MLWLTQIKLVCAQPLCWTIVCGRERWRHAFERATLGVHAVCDLNESHYEHQGGTHEIAVEYVEWPTGANQRAEEEWREGTADEGAYLLAA